MAKRLQDDIDGMYEDIKENYLTLTVAELTDLLMEERHDEQSENDLVEDWLNFCDGEFLCPVEERRNREIDEAWERYKDERIND